MFSLDTRGVFSFRTKFLVLMPVRLFFTDDEATILRGYMDFIQVKKTCTLSSYREKVGICMKRKETWRNKNTLRMLILFNLKLKAAVSRKCSRFLCCCTSYSPLLAMQPNVNPDITRS